MMQLWEARVPGFSFQNNNDLQHQHDQCKCQSITKRDIFKLVFNILTHHLVINIPWSLFQIFKFTKFIQSTINNKILMHTISIFIFQGKVNKMCVHWKWNLSNKILKPTNNKLINQTFCKYIRRAICLVLIINSKCQWGHGAHNLFAHRLYCTLAYP